MVKGGEGRSGVMVMMMVVDEVHGTYMVYSTDNGGDNDDDDCSGDGDNSSGGCDEQL